MGEESFGPYLSDNHQATLHLILLFKQRLPSKFSNPTFCYLVNLIHLSLQNRILQFLGGAFAYSWMKSSQRIFWAGHLPGRRKIWLMSFQKKSSLFGGSLLVHGASACPFLGQTGSQGATFLPVIQFSKSTRQKEDFTSKSIKRVGKLFLIFTEVI